MSYKNFAESDTHWPIRTGSDENYFLERTTPIPAQRLGHVLGYTLSTNEMVHQA